MAQTPFDQKGHRLTVWRATSNTKERRLTPMCVQNNRCGQRRMARQSLPENGGSNGCGCGCSCGCGCDTGATVPTATISMADYQPFILVPTSVFDQGDEGCGCGYDW